jgi:hypothetical protein
MPAAEQVAGFVDTLGEQSASEDLCARRLTIELGAQPGEPDQAAAAADRGLTEYETQLAGKQISVEQGQGEFGPRSASGDQLVQNQVGVILLTAIDVPVSVKRQWSAEDHVEAECLCQRLNQ